MVEGAAYVGSWIYLSEKMMLWGQPRGQNVLDTGAHFYETYQTKDNKFMAVGAIEPQFYAEMLQRLDIQDLPQGINDEEAKAELKKVFLSKTRQELSEIFEGSDACVTPILELHEAPEHPHNKARNSFVKNHKGDIIAPVSNLQLRNMKKQVMICIFRFLHLDYPEHRQWQIHQFRNHKWVKIQLISCKILDTLTKIFKSYKMPVLLKLVTAKQNCDIKD